MQEIACSELAEITEPQNHTLLCCSISAPPLFLGKRIFTTPLTPNRKIITLVEFFVSAYFLASEARRALLPTRDLVVDADQPAA